MPEATITKTDPSQWQSAAEPMTSRQSWYLKSLCEKAGLKFDNHLTKAEASQEIDRLQAAKHRPVVK